MSSHFLGDTAVLTQRSLKHVTRSVDTIITTAIVPIAIMLLFVYVFGGAMRTGSDTYVTYVLPGILLMTIAMGVPCTSYRLFIDQQRGILDRFRSLPIARSATLWAHVLTSMAANAVSVIIVIVIAALMGFRSGAGPAAWLAVVGILALFTLALTWVVVIADLLARSVEGASVFSYPLIVLPFVSSAFVPTASMPGPVRWFAEHQPVTAIVNTLRALLDGRPAGDDIVSALAWCLAILAVSHVVAMMVYRRTAS